MDLEKLNDAIELIFQRYGHADAHHDPIMLRAISLLEGFKQEIKLSRSSGSMNEARKVMFIKVMLVRGNRPRFNEDGSVTYLNIVDGQYKEKEITSC